MGHNTKWQRNLRLRSESTKNGDHYWVFAHATPTFNDEGKIISYHSNRTAPSRVGIEYIEGIYNLLLKEENSHADPERD